VFLCLCNEVPILVLWFYPVIAYAPINTGSGSPYLNSFASGSKRFARTWKALLHLWHRQALPKMATALFGCNLPRNDVKLVFLDGSIVHAHKYILAGCFNFFEAIFDTADDSVVEMRHCPEFVTAERVCMVLSHLYEDYILPGVHDVRRMCRGHFYALEQVNV
jgi:hypothetical protein